MHRTTFTHDKKTANVWMFDSPGDFADFAELNLRGTTYGQRPADSFYGGTDTDTAFRHCREGDRSLVANSDRIMGMIEDKVGFVSSRFEVHRAVAGGAPDVPAYLAGHPVAMRRRVRTVSEAAPIAIVADVVSSGVVPVGTIQRRGAALLALARLLESTRPVTVHAVTGQHQSGKTLLCSVRIDTSPLDLARAAWLLSSPEFTRRITFAASEHNAGRYGGGVVQWAFHSDKWQREHLCATFADLLGVTDHVASPGIYVGTEFATDEGAAEWVLEQARRLQGRAG